MSHLLRSLRPFTLAALTLAASPALAGELAPLGDTVLEPLGTGDVAATSATDEPAVRHDRPTMRFGFDLSDVDEAEPPVIALSTAVTRGSATGSFTLTFNGATTARGYFDGRFLRADDLKREQGYRPEVGGSFAATYGYELFRGGVRVAAGDLEGGIAPFVLEGLDRFDTAHTAAPRAMPGGGEQIEIHSWSFGSSGWTATFDHGAALAVDGLVVRVREPASSLRTRVGATTARAGGVAELRIGNEDMNVPDGAPLAARVVPTAGGASVDMWTTGVGTVDVHGVTVAASPTLTARTTVFEAPAGGLVRLRTRRDGGAFGPWSGWASHGHVVSGNPVGADQAIDEYQLELLPAAGTPTIAVHGYVKIKKLNSGG